MKIVYETGKIRELGESIGQYVLRFYTHIELEREDGTIVKLYDVAVSQDVTPKLGVDGELATFAIVRKAGVLLDRPLLLGGQATRYYYKNMLLGYAGAGVYGVQRDEKSWLLRVAQVATILLAAAILFLYHVGVWLIFLSPLILMLMFTANAWYQGSSFSNAVKAIVKRFEELGYKNYVSKVYS